MLTRQNNSTIRALLGEGGHGQNCLRNKRPSSQMTVIEKLKCNKTKQVTSEDCKDRVFMVLRGVFT